jgi:hypothetical protein
MGDDHNIFQIAVRGLSLRYRGYKARGLIDLRVHRKIGDLLSKDSSVFSSRRAKSLLELSDIIFFCHCDVNFGTTGR